jgi:hypothetical protein
MRVLRWFSLSFEYFYSKYSKKLFPLASQCRSTIFLSQLKSLRTTHSNRLGDRCQFVGKCLSVVVFKPWWSISCLFFRKLVCFLITTDSRNILVAILFDLSPFSSLRSIQYDYFLPPVHLCIASPFETLLVPPLKWEYLRIFCNFFQSIFLAVYHVVSDRAIRIICSCSFQLIYDL